MDNSKISENEQKILFEAAEEYLTNGRIKINCPRCNGKLKHMGNKVSYCIFCEKECGIRYSIRGI